MSERESIPKLKERLKTVESADDVRAIYREEVTNPDGERSGAMTAIKDRAEELGMTEEQLRPNDATEAENTAGAQPIAGEALTESDYSDHAERIARLEELAKSSEGNPGAVPDGKEFDARKEVLKLHRGLEYLANQLNLRLPQ